ncbi:corazonin [Caerostris extrusa]|uniref:Pro-corazonin n=1 Tax=Caerostris extrusa TaxID=172846 RepID=A0AAV4RQK4_CAEEX|nr:corazonin [Caerostris extrusa]
MKSATAVTILLVLQLALSTAGQTYQYSRGWTNGRKRSHEVDKELQQYPLTFSSTRPKDFDDDWLEIKYLSLDFKFKIENSAYRVPNTSNFEMYTVQSLRAFNYTRN